MPAAFLRPHGWPPLLGLGVALHVRGRHEASVWSRKLPSPASSSRPALAVQATDLRQRTATFWCLGKVSAQGSKCDRHVLPGDVRNITKRYERYQTRLQAKNNCIKRFKRNGKSRKHGPNGADGLERGMRHAEPCFAVLRSVVTLGAADIYSTRKALKPFCFNLWSAIPKVPNVLKPPLRRQNVGQPATLAAGIESSAKTRQVRTSGASTTTTPKDISARCYSCYRVNWCWKFHPLLAELSPLGFRSQEARAKQRQNALP